VSEGTGAREQASVLQSVRPLVAGVCAALRCSSPVSVDAGRGREARRAATAELTPHDLRAARHRVTDTVQRRLGRST